MTVEEYFDRLDARESRMMGEKPRVIDLVPETKRGPRTGEVDKQVGEIAKTIPEDIKFNMAAVAREHDITTNKFAWHLKKWCAKNNKKLTSSRGGQGETRGSMISSEKEEE